MASSVRPCLARTSPRLSCARQNGIEFQGLAITCDGIIEFRLTGQGHAQVVVSQFAVGCEFHGLVVVGDGLVELSAASQNLAEVVVSHFGTD